MGGVLTETTDFAEEPVDQQRSRSLAAHLRINGDGQQLRTLRTLTGTVAEGFQDPAPGSQEATRAGQCSGRPVTKNEGAVEAGHIGGAGEESNRGCPVVDDE
jgi:hypothetical protein